MYRYVISAVLAALLALPLIFTKNVSWEYLVGIAAIILALNLGEKFEIVRNLRDKKIKIEDR